MIFENAFAEGGPMKERGGPPRTDVVGLMLGILTTIFIERATKFQTYLAVLDPWLTYALALVTVGVVVVFVVDVIAAARRRAQLNRRPEWDRAKNPYPGLLAYGADRGPVYFGRRDEVRTLVNWLRYPSSTQQRFIPVVG